MKPIILCDVILDPCRTKMQSTLCQYVPLHHPDGAAGGATSITDVSELPVEARRSVSEGLLTLSKQLHWIGHPLPLQDKT